MNPRLVNMLPQVGVYTLMIHLTVNIRLKVGKLGENRFPRGYYTYTGSALGSGASSLGKRVARHLQKKQFNSKKKLRWHIDFLLATKDVQIEAVIAAFTKRKEECQVNRQIEARSKAEVLIPRFGASDCKENCGSHLLFFPDIIKDDFLIQTVVNCFYALDFQPCILQF